MTQTSRGRPRARLTTLRMGEITMAMGVAMAAGLGVGLAALAVDTAWFWPPPVELGTIAGARVLLGSVTSGLITVAVFGLWMRTVVVGLMAAHFSPRTLLIFLHDRFQRNLLAFMSAGVVAVLVILLRMPTDEQAAKRYDEASALLAYQSSLRAISEIGELAQEVGDVDFAWRKQHSFPVRWLSRAALKDEYGLKAPAAILSSVAARVDPYRLASRLLERIQRQGARVFDRTEVTSITATERSVQLTTDSGMLIKAKHAVVASGYESQNWLQQRVAKNLSSYAYISDPVDPGELRWLANTMLWESSRPYIYLRSTGDGRLLVGGEDDDRDVPERRDRLVDRKAATLQRKVARLFPHLNAQPAFAWAGTFAETSDGLPLFGHHPQYGPRVLFALAYGGNGITYSMLGAGLLRAQIERRPHPLTELFAFARLG